MTNLHRICPSWSGIQPPWERRAACESQTWLIFEAVCLLLLSEQESSQVLELSPSIVSVISLSIDGREVANLG